MDWVGGRFYCCRRMARMSICAYIRVRYSYFDLTRAGSIKLALTKKGKRRSLAGFRQNNGVFLFGWLRLFFLFNWNRLLNRVAVQMPGVELYRSKNGGYIHVTPANTQLNVMYLVQESASRYWGKSIPKNSSIHLNEAQATCFPKACVRKTTFVSRVVKRLPGNYG